MPGRLHSNSVDWRSNPKAIQKYTFLHRFLPDAQKKKRSPFLSLKALFLYALVLSSMLVSFRVAPAYFPGVLGYASNIYVDELLRYTNEIRAEHGLAPLKLNAKLSQAADAKAHDMFKKNYWAHVSPDGTQPWDFILDSGYDYSYAGENLAKNFNASKEVVRAWYDSPSHRENLLSANYRDVGFAIVNGVLDGYETTLVVQTFGSPRGFVPQQVSNQSLEIHPEAVSVSAPSVEGISRNVPTLISAGAPDQPLLDVASATRFMGFGFMLFMMLLLVLDIWYSRVHGIRKVTGHALAHLLFLLFVFGSIWLAVSPGRIL